MLSVIASLFSLLPQTLVDEKEKAKAAARATQEADSKATGVESTVVDSQQPGDEESNDKHEQQEASGNRQGAVSGSEGTEVADGTT